MIHRAACPSCKVMVLDMHDPEVARRNALSMSSTREEGTAAFAAHTCHGTS
jgi:hypothetical protein